MAVKSKLKVDLLKIKATNTTQQETETDYWPGNLALTIYCTPTNIVMSKQTENKTRTFSSKG